MADQIHSAEVAGPVFQKLPAYLAKTRYALPLDNVKGPFQYSHDTPLPIWQWRSERPEIEQAFMNHMIGYRRGLPSWTDEGFYPINDRIAKGMKAGEGEVAMVDIGGNVGYDLQELKTSHPSLPGRFVLQDRPEVISTIPNAIEGVEPTSYDFFTEQPIKGTSDNSPQKVAPFWIFNACQIFRRSSVLHALRAPRLAR